MSELAQSQGGSGAFDNGIRPGHQDYPEIEAISRNTGTPVDQVGGPLLGDVAPSPIPAQE